MEKQYLGINDPAAIINALVAQLTSVETTLGYALKTTEMLTLENTKLRDELKAARVDL